MNMFPQWLALFSMPGGPEWIAIVILGILIFGSRLPDIARSLGRSVVEFKKGMREIEDDTATGAGKSTKDLNPPANPK